MSTGPCCSRISRRARRHSPSGLLTADTNRRAVGVGRLQNRQGFRCHRRDHQSSQTEEFGLAHPNRRHHRHERLRGFRVVLTRSTISDTPVRPTSTPPSHCRNRRQHHREQDLHRKKVPDPIKAPENDGDATNDGSASEKAGDTQWPIITGYGAYVDELPQLVSGHQWMTAVEDRKGAATQLAQMCLKINQGTAVKSPQRPDQGGRIRASRGRTCRRCAPTWSRSARRTSRAR